MKKKAFLCAFFLLIPLFSQAEDPGRIQGQVTKAGKPIGGVDVVLKGFSLSTVTDKNGAYAFDRLRPGKYTLIFKQGENSVTKEDMVVTSGSPTQGDVDVEWEVLLAHTLTVHAASRRTERVVDAPAAVSVVEEAEIERGIAHGELPKIMDTTPGVDSTQSGLYDFNLNTRGFNSSLNRRVLTLMDGVDMSIILLGAQNWPLVSSFLPDLASLELVRGPGSALYGANAYNGVFNISSKDPRYSQGGMIRFALGEPGTARLDLRYSSSLGKDWYFTILGGYMEGKGFTQSRNESVEYEGLPREAVPLQSDTLKSLNAKIRLDKHFGSGSVLTFETWFVDHKGDAFIAGSSRMQGKNTSIPLGRVNFHSPHWNISAYSLGGVDFQGISLASGAQMNADLSRIHGEIQGFTDFAKGKGRLVGGFSIRREGVDSADEQGVQTLTSKAIDERTEAVFGQLDYFFTDKLKLVLAGRVDFSTLHDPQFSPKAALVYSFNPGHSLRLSISQAFQSPNYSEFFMKIPAAPPVDLSAIENGLSAAFGGRNLGLGFKNIPVLALGNENLKVEEITGVEMGYSNIFARKLIFHINYFRNRLKNFITDPLPGVNPSYGPYVPPSDLPPEIQAAVVAILQQNVPQRLFALMSNSLEDGSAIFAAASITNAGKANSQGIELDLRYFLGKRWNVDFNYTWFDYTVKEELIADKILANTPKHRINLGMAYVSDRFDLSLRYRWVDGFPWAVGVYVGDVKSYSLIDLTSNFKIGEGFSLGVNIGNVLNNKHYEIFGGDILRRRAVAGISYRW
jgi:iron complex outermembrane receptor protein